MNRTSRKKKLRITHYVLIITFILVMFLGIFNRVTANKEESVSAAVHSEDSNRMVSIEMSDGNIMTTDEKNIYYEGDKVIYRSKFYEIDITGGTIKYEDE